MVVLYADQNNNPNMSLSRAFMLYGIYNDHNMKTVINGAHWDYLISFWVLLNDNLVEVQR